MKQQIVQTILSFYGLLLRLYPDQFREEFGEEMTAVFTQALTKAAQTRSSTLLLFCLREVRDLPFSLLREHWHNLTTTTRPDIKRRIAYLAALIILGLAWLLFSSYIWGSHWPPNGGLFSLILSYLPFILGLIIIICWLFALSTTWFKNKITNDFWPTAGFLALVLLFLPASTFRNPEGLAPFLLVSLALIIVAGLLYSAVRLYRNDWSNCRPLSQRLPPNRKAQIIFSLGLLLLLKALHTTYWLFIWDSTGDSLDFLWLSFPILAVLFGGISLFFILPERTKLAAWLYLLLIPGLLIGVYSLTRSVDFRQLTEARAARTIEAVEAYYSQEGHYPESLGQLTPRYILSVPQPVIIYGQKWCYEGGPNYYRLGYVNREHWSAPYLIGTLHKAAGDVPDIQPLCREAVTKIQEQHPNFPYEYWTANE
jgi:hypothetical protein